MTGPTRPGQLRTSTAALRIVLVYTIVAIAWIALSDLAVDALFNNPAHLVWVNMLKGWLFVLVTAGLLYGLITRLVSRIKQLAAEREALEIEQQARLERRVAQRTAELQAANEELNSFAYAVSHDLRAPLRAMNGFSEALIEDHHAELDPAARGHLDQIRAASARMHALIDGLLALSRATRGDLDRSRVNLSEIVSRQLEDLQIQEPERTVEAIIEPNVVVEGDQRMLEAVTANLVHNAWKYSAGLERAVIRFGTTQLDGQTAVYIEDNGAGFDMRHAAALFKPFQRLHRQDEFPGIGIGLATVQRIIHRHGGDVIGEARRNEGARFVFTTCPRESG